MQALVLDFDGVIFDSVRESFAVARRSYLELEPQSDLAKRDESALFERFFDLMPLGNRAEDYGAVMAALEAGLSLRDQAAYDEFRATRDAAWLERYHRRFYEVRAAIASSSPERWHALHRPYERFVNILRRRSGDVAYAIATSKDLRSAQALLSAHAMADLFAPHLILDKETGPSKAVHLERLQALLGVPFAEMTFVDDKVNHLDSVSPLGVRCAIAAWGYNGPREHDLARRRGYLVCTLDDAEAKLFGLLTRR